MKARRLTQALLALVLAFSMAQSAQAITTLGRHPFYQPPLQSVGDLYTMVAEEKDQIKIGLRAAGLRPVYDSFMEQIGTAEIREVEYQKGTELQWMFFRRNGNGPLRLDKGVVWESDTPFQGYEFDIDHEGERYTFVVPLACGNLALMGVGPIPAEPVAAAPVEQPAEEPAPAPVVEAAPKAMPWVADVGLLYQVDPATYLIARIGYEYFLSDNVSALGMVGVAPKLEGTDGESAFIIEGYLNYYFNEKWYTGLGLGGWFTDGDDDIDGEDSDLDVILNIGTEIYEKPDAFKMGLYVEMRSAVDELDDLDLYGQVGAGVRFKF